MNRFYIFSLILSASFLSSCYVYENTTNLTFNSKIENDETKVLFEISKKQRVLPFLFTMMVFDRNKNAFMIDAGVLNYKKNQRLISFNYSIIDSMDHVLLQENVYNDLTLLQISQFLTCIKKNVKIAELPKKKFLDSKLYLNINAKIITEIGDTCQIKIEKQPLKVEEFKGFCRMI